MAFNPPETVPYFTRTGNMFPYPTGETEMRPNKAFRADLQVVSIERGQSASRFILRDPETGIDYPVFMIDALEIMRNGVRKGGRVKGLWQAGKRGANYGLRLVGQ